jgi:acyl-ACP thioesterase
MDVKEIPVNSTDVVFTVRSYEAGIENRVALPTLCNYMQEAAGISADRLGWGIRALQDEGLTWMLSRLRVSVARYVPWGASVTVRTWPSGMKGKLLATRSFYVTDQEGQEIARAESQWLYVDRNANKIEKLPDSFASLVPAGTPSVQLEDLGGKTASLPAITHTAEIRVRHSDLDFNDHVNNVHYVAWMLETLPSRTGPVQLDIAFRSAAKATDVLASQCFCEGEKSLHQIKRVSDDALLATAAMRWA